ncbi:MAG: NADH-dependent [FeFe] hydrogenase, group A6 [Alphaproteobacteria bacterium]|nr:NADH-dependent [FeFe] hydrogenase, group A6 [Alphaproteobacteria bacterium]
MVKLKIDNMEIDVPAGTTILEAARRVKVDIPSLCYHRDLNPRAACGICVVKNKGKTLRSCCTAVEEGMDITTRDPELIETRRTILKLVLSNHPSECLTCIRNDNCELRRLAATFGLREVPFDDITPSLKDRPIDTSTDCIHIDSRKCILCGRCVEACQVMQKIHALTYLDRGIKSRVGVAGGLPLGDSPCVRCGQCTAHCPTGALTEEDHSEQVWALLQNPDNHMVVQIAPAVRVALGEEFGLPVGTLVTGKIYTALRNMGFKVVFDTNFGADMTIMEEATEFVKRFTNRICLPMVTSCCPAWVNYMEKYFPDMIPHFSTCKSPHQMVGVLAKTYYAQKAGIDPAKMKVISIMPCTAKKMEITLPDMKSSGYQDVDYVLTTRELARMIKQAGIEFTKLDDGVADSPLGEYSGAGTVFGYTGGVMIAALRTAHFLITGKEMAEEDLEIKPILGIDKGVKEMTMRIDGSEIRIAVAHGIGHIAEVLERVRAALAKGAEPPYHFVEVMTCPGGCVGGGGQPCEVTDEVRIARANGLRQDDKQSKKRCSHQNANIQKVYKDFLGAPNGEKAHHLLHTHYTARPLYKK